MFSYRGLLDSPDSSEEPEREICPLLKHIMIVSISSECKIYQHENKIIDINVGRKYFVGVK